MLLSSQKVAARVKGMPMPMKTAMCPPRNTHATSTTSNRPSAALFCMMRRASRVVAVWSSSSFSSSPSGASTGFLLAM